MHHNWLQDALVDFCHSARLGVKVEVGSQLTPDLRQSCPADALVADWERERPAAWDVTVTSPLTPAFLNEAGMTAAAATEQGKHTANDPKCQELSWVCVSLALETYGNWGREAHTPLLVWPLGLQSVFLCQKVGSLLTFMGDLVWC